MNLDFLFVGLALISGLTTLTVEALKKLLDEGGKTYSPNLLAVIVSIVLTIAASIGYIIIQKIPVTASVIVEILAMIFLAFLCSTLGFDKIKQTIIQVLGK